ncbi:MAG: hypothetical protein PHQ43_13215 [Dehalococcoidales bacterium]|nr:hypothetical protein [Dehalococcoidales bacterium]
MAWWDKEGITVLRVAAALPQTNTQDIFSVVGGRIRLKLLVGEVTVIIGGVANSTYFRFTPTGGAATDLCAAGTDVNADAVRTMYGITGIVTDAMLKGVGLVPAPTQDTILKAGTIHIRCLGNDGGGGRVQYALTYVPIDVGAYVLAA